ncbi:MAG: protein translocase subunit SecD [Burkholderiales bacterium]
MNRYPAWKNILIVVALVLGFLYTLPNFFGEAPALQIAPVRATAKVDAAMLGRVQDALKNAKIPYSHAVFQNNSVRVQFDDTDTQLKARDLLDKLFNLDEKNPSHVVALYLEPKSPSWLAKIGALPMALGLDLRGGVHLLMQVDMKSALDKKVESYASDIRFLLRERKIYYSGVAREGQRVIVRFSDEAARQAASKLLANEVRGLTLKEDGAGSDLSLIGTISPVEEKEIEKAAIGQNILTLRNRINELGTKEPIIQQQGVDRIIVDLPGVQDPAKVKEILGRTATLEIRLVDEENDPNNAVVPFTSERVVERNGIPVLVKKQVVLTGEVITDAGAGYDQDNRPSVNISMDGKGARVIKQVSRDNIKKRMAILMVEKNRKEAISVATIQSELGARFQITGLPSPQEASDLALLLRAGALAAPMEFVEERTVGPSLGAENIAKGFHSTWIGFAAISVFMIAYYMLFGTISVLALAINVLFLIGLLSLMQATLTLPGMAGIALTVGMAIDANVLINERIREELRNGVSPQKAIEAGYERAFGTILDSNVTTLIAGLALFAFGSGPIKGFAVVLCLGILTSMFSAVVVSRGLVNLIYGSKRKLESLSIGNVAWAKNRSAKSAK